MRKYENLVFKGGGVKGIAYIGALKILEDKNILKNIKRVAGTSAGAIIATLISLEYTNNELYDIFMNLDFKKFEDKFYLFNFKKYGFHSGDKFVKYMRNFISNSKFKFAEEATFNDFKKAGCRDLLIFSTNLSSQEKQEFSYEETPNMKVVDAIRMSMSIPAYFTSMKYKDDLMVDGGVVYNYPIDAFDNGKINTKTLGLHLTTYEQKKRKIEYNKFFFFHPIKYVKNLINYNNKLFEAIINSQELILKTQPQNLQRTINIDDCGISAIDFNLTNNCKQELYVSGLLHTNNFFNNK